MTQKLTVGIIGARAYTSRELLRILRRHSGIEVVALQARVEANEPIEVTFPEFRGAGLPPVSPLGVEALPADLSAAFLCLPHTVGAKYAPSLIAQGIRVFDLSADFRFRDHKIYEATYKETHPAPDLNRQAVYGLPELNRATIVGARLVGCAGCYPTAVTLALAPLMKYEMVELDSLVADCKSGVSGAGRGLSETTHYCNANESVAAYKVAEHRHEPEIAENLSRLAGREASLTFVPHLMPMDRGILATCYARLIEPIDVAALTSLYEQRYRNEPFVRLLPAGELPCTKTVSHTNYCDISLRVDKRHRHLIVISAIDNLIKGASGQAVQCMNISFGLRETEGLT